VAFISKGGNEVRKERPGAGSRVR